MADILIRGIEMPQNCGDCYLCHGMFCFGLKKLRSNKDYRERPDNCPLHELPEHGDLIDRDKLLEEDVDLFIEYDDFEDESGCSTDVIRNAPTIIPSNKEETE